MPAVVGDIFQLTMQGECFLQRVLLTHHYRLTVTDGTTEDVDIAQVLADGARAGLGGGDVLETAYINCLPGQYRLLNVIGQSIVPRTRRRVIPRGSVGQFEADTDTVNQAAVITLQTDASGRNQVSNKHIGPIPQSTTVQDEGILTVLYKELLATLRDQLLTSISNVATTITLTPIIYHPTLGINFSTLTAGYVQDTIRTMRRRTLRVGE